MLALLWPAGSAQAQTGPGGVGNATGAGGQPQTAVWLKADEGAQDIGGSLFRWLDQSGNGNHAEAPSGAEPQRIDDAIGGQPGISFDRNQPTYLTVPDAPELDATGGVSIFTAVRPRTIGTLVSKRDGVFTFGYEVDVAKDIDSGVQYDAVGVTIGNEFFGRYLTPYAGGAGDVDPEVSQIISARSNGSQADTYLDAGRQALEGGLPGIDATTSPLGIGGRSGGTEGFQGDIGEIVVFSDVVNQAQRLIVESYLARKYASLIASAAATDTIGYAYADAYADRWAAIGRTDIDGSVHTTADAGALRMSVSAFGGTGKRFVGMAHNGASTALGFESSEPVNSAPSTITRMAREWRVDMTGGLNGGSRQITLSVPASAIPSLPAGVEPALIVNSDPAFASGSRLYTFTDAGSRYEVTVTLNDGEVLTLGGVERLVSFSEPSYASFENAASVPGLVLSLNHPHPVETGRTVEATLSAGEAGPFGAEGPAAPGVGSDDDDASASDYNLSTGTVSIVAGATQTTLPVTLHNDPVAEQSQAFEAVLTSPVNASLGTASTVFTILDDDNPRKIGFVSSSRSVLEGTGGTRIESIALELPSGFPAASSSPCTSVEVRLDPASDVIAGPTSDPVNDLQFVDEPAGAACSEYQERLSPTSARLYVGAGQTTATFDVRINEDAITDDGVESAIFQLAVPYSSAIEPATSTFTLTINDDESALETVAFSTDETVAREGTSTTLTVTLLSALSRDVSVPFAVDAGATTATDGTDFSIPTASPITIPAGQTSASIQLDVLDDATPELGEQIVVNLQTPTGAVLGSPSGITVAIDDDDALGATGPAGVGSRETNILWLRADAFRAPGGTNVRTWADDSGNGNDVEAASGSEPVYRTSGLGGQPTLEFAGTPMETGMTRNGPISMFVVGRADIDGAFVEIYDDLVAYRNRLDVFQSDIYYGTAGQGGTFSYVNPPSAGGAGVFSVIHDGSSVTLGRNGSFNIDNGVDDIGRSNSLIVGNDYDGASIGDDVAALQGEIGEVIVYRAALNTTQRQIVENALAAKYAQTLASGDVYAGTFTREVFGIGRTSSADFHASAEQGGLRFDARNGLEDGDFVLAGHDVASNRLITSDVTSFGPDPARSNRTWSVDVTNTGAAVTADITFDISGADLSGLPGDASQYRLLFSASQPFSWTVAEEADETSGDRILFRNVDVTALDGGFITVLTRDEANANLDSQALVIRGTADNEAPGDVNGGRGGDAGWRLISIPGTGSIVDDLFTLRDPQLVEFNLPGTEDMFYRWTPDVNAGTGGWAASVSGDDLVQGRGYMVYLFDNERDMFEPIDPTLTINARNLSRTPSTANVVVGDAPGAGDPPLSADSEWFVLGNPYSVSFSLSGLNLNQDADLDGALDFNQNVQIWDTAVNSWVAFSEIDPTNNAVAPWQGFFVQRSDMDASGGTAETLTFDATATTTGVPFVGSKSGGGTQRRALLNLELVVNDEQGDVLVKDRTASVVFHDAGRKGPDAYDAPALYPYATPYIDAVLRRSGDDARYSRISLPWPDAEQRIEMPIDASGITQPVTLRVADWSGVPDGWTVELLDRGDPADPSDDARHALGEAGSFTFVHGDAATSKSALSSSQVRAGVPVLSLPEIRTGASKASGPARLQLIVTPNDDPLPVDLARFQVTASAEEAVVEWSTASETRNSGFFVEHQRVAAGDSTAADGNWSTLGFVEGAGTTDKPRRYRYRAGRLDVGRHAFRLRQVDTDGAANVSRVQYLQVDLRRPFRIGKPYPNPAPNGARLDVAVKEAQPITIQVYDILGRRVETTVRERLPAGETQTIDISTQRLASGTYFLRITGEGFAATRRLSVVK